MAISVESNNGFLRLRWSHQKERHTLYLGMKDTKTNRLKAQPLILTIEADIEEGTFDPSLNKYRNQTQSKTTNFSANDLFDKWLGEYKSQLVDERTVKWYKHTKIYLIAALEGRSASGLSSTDAIAFLSHLKKQDLAAQTIKRILQNLKACWDWGIKNGFIQQNIWENLAELIKADPPNRPRPFSDEEVKAIVAGFKKLYPDYEPIIKFLFLTGCRIGEARALQWGDISSDCSRIEIRASMNDRGKRKGTKTHKNRTLVSSEPVRNLLKQLKGRGTQFVFVSDGKAINHRKLAGRWQRVLAKAGIDYRKAYNTRHTFISHALEKGVPPLALASQTGHDTQTLFEYYAGSLPNTAKLPEVFDF
ncbi:hypothetical protein NIES2119_08035 [[Phormidium ambiguum] IAM M-71]|uniref:Tyr recombinase domain-containing protein n=1 Tax=[Phormidium ambiguum] IAM M-71 TaxID=454136 RepID=A0A1U7IP89_9CYAN|nr:site-specific integrase [Phormidium ambiguum]OKH39069.1 hypothetical protein NIES2119_08035 [Phormidium ambiguum IAM M-71]